MKYLNRVIYTLKEAFWARLSESCKSTVLMTIVVVVAAIVYKAVDLGISHLLMK